MLHTDILSQEQKKLVKLLRVAKKRSFYLVGGTAISLHIGHRKSIDFDLFRSDDFASILIHRILEDAQVHWQKLQIREEGQFQGIINDVKIAFLYYPYHIETTIDFSGYIKMPDLLTLSAMKAFALGRRAKWKDYVDMYFILRDHYDIHTVSSKAQEIFGTLFQTSQFIEQLMYFEGINYSETIEYLIENPPSDEDIRIFLTKIALDY